MKHIYEAVGSVFKFVAGNKNGTKNGINGNGINGNGLDPKLYSSADLHIIDRVYQSASKTLDRIRNYKPPEPEVRKELLYRPEQAQIDEALRQQHTYHHLIQNHQDHQMTSHNGVVNIKLVLKNITETSWQL